MKKIKRQLSLMKNVPKAMAEDIITFVGNTDLYVLNISDDSLGVIVDVWEGGFYFDEPTHTATYWFDDYVEELELGQYFYYINEYGKFLRKVIWISEHSFEWNSGWANISQLTLNEDKKSKVKFILNEL